MQVISWVLPAEMAGAAGPRKLDALSALASSLLALGALLTLGLWTGSAAYDVLPRFDLQSSPIAGAKVELAGSSKRLSDRVVVVLVDGLGDEHARRLPGLRRLAAQGSWSTLRAFYPSYTAPMMAALLTGVEPRYSGLRTNLNLRALDIDSLPNRAIAAGMTTAVIGQASTWLARLTPDGWSDVRSLPSRLDLFEKWAKPSLDRKPDLAVVYLSQVDVMGHIYGARSKPYAQAAIDVDAAIERIAKTLDLSRETLVVISDHGHRARGGHGGQEREVLEVPLIMVGAGVQVGAAVSGGRSTDFAPTIAALLGLPAPQLARGHVLADALLLAPAERAEIERRDNARVRAVNQAASRFDERAARNRNWHVLARASVLLAAAFAYVWIARKLARRRWLVWDRRVLLFAAPVFPIAFYGFLFAYEGSFSISVLSEFWPVVERLFRFGAGAAGLYAVVAWIAMLGREPRDRLAAISGLTLAGLATVTLPGIIAYAAIGGTTQSIPPSSYWTFFAMLSYAGVTCYCIASAAVLALELAIFAARFGYRPANTATQPDGANRDVVR